jgi:hypothetical protein
MPTNDFTTEALRATEKSTNTDGNYRISLNAFLCVSSVTSVPSVVESFRFVRAMRSVVSLFFPREKNVEMEALGSKNHDK